MKKLFILLIFTATLALPVLAQNDTTKVTDTETAEVQVQHNEAKSEDLTIYDHVEKWYSEHMNNWTVAALMTIESSFIPFPSEIVIPPAVYVADNKDSDLHITDNFFINVCIIVLFGTLGAVLGAIINYLLAMWLGRPVIYAFSDSKLGHLLMLSSDKVKQAEDYFNKRGKISTFIGRLIPGIRQLISIPAGLCRMHFGWFLFYTFLGAGIWNVVLALLGILAEGQKEKIEEYSHEVSIVLMAGFGILVLYFIIKALIKRRKK